DRGPGDRGVAGQSAARGSVSQHLPVKYLLDTNVYLGAVRSEESRARFRHAFFPLLPATFLSAVVAYELNVDARDRRTRNLIRDFLRPLERTGTPVCPAFQDGVEA